jgi:parallel beta-helix repeat protein
MGNRFNRVVVGAFGTVALVAAAVGITAGPAAADAGHWGPPFPSASLSVGCGRGGFPTVNAAVQAATPGATVTVCPGTYDEDVVIPPTKSLSILGIGNPVIDATGLLNGVQILASRSRVQGLTVKNAIGEGILVQGVPGTPITGVTVSGNTVIHNDQGNPTGAPLTTSTYPECNGSAEAPGDCGEGIHLMEADDSSVVGNNVTGNSGGILMTDEFGPTDGNTVAFNNVSDNTFDCGITIAGHNQGAFANGEPQSTAGGVFDNRILYNSVSGNGVAGQGAGVLLATPFPGGAVYDNQVLGNRIWGNGLAGVTVHSHAPGQDLNGNVIEANLIGTNNVDGDPDFYPSVDPSTTGVIVAAVAPLTITIEHNVIADDVYGVWTLPAVTAIGTSSNLYVHVTTPVFVAP